MKWNGNQLMTQIKKDDKLFARQVKKERKNKRKKSTLKMREACLIQRK